MAANPIQVYIDGVMVADTITSASYSITSTELHYSEVAGEDEVLWTYSGSNHFLGFSKTQSSTTAEFGVGSSGQLGDIQAAGGTLNLYSVDIVSKLVDNIALNEFLIKSKQLFYYASNPNGFVESSAVLWEHGVDANDAPVEGAIKSKDFTSGGTTYTNTASGISSLAFGAGNSVTANYGVTLGYGNTVSSAGSMAFGGNNTVETGTYAFAFGAQNHATGSNSHAEGSLTSATANSAHSEGSSTSASGQASHAEGAGTTATANYAHAEGQNTQATGTNSHAEGKNTQATGFQSHAEGYQSYATATNAHAEGKQTTASGNQSHSSGTGTVANSMSQTVFGEYNVVDSGFTAANARGTYVEIVGNGADAQNLSNARTLDWNGNEVLAGKLTVGAVPTANMDVATKQYVDNAIPTTVWEQGVDSNGQPVPGAIKAKDFVNSSDVTKTNSAPWTGVFVAGGGNTATGSYAVIAGEDNTANGSSTVFGYNNTAAGGGGSTLLGNSNQATSGTWGFAAGVGNTISHNNVTALGWYNTASNYNAVAMGRDNIASGNSSSAIGYGNTASETAAHAEGRNTTASGKAAHSEGYATEASGCQSHAEGQGTQATARYNHVFGTYNISDPGFTAATERGTYIEIVGNGDDAQNRSNARTLDWSGNEWLAGLVSVGSSSTPPTPTANNHLTTKKYVDDIVGNIETLLASI